MTTRRNTKAQRDLEKRARELPCALCMFLGRGETPGIPHHIKDHTGGSLRSAECFSLCEPDHDEFHRWGKEAWEKKYGVTQIELWRRTAQELGISELL